ncbi:MAG: RNA pseudouridine synthase [Treponema sp.]|jgi:23S rRNA pseudouridine1911/1915/1917 synthase|nr:RNA pseudouridine synthase [Treponema sp.]
MVNTIHTIEERILYQSDACVVVNKLPGEAVEGAKTASEDLPKALAERLGAAEGTLFAVHRLDVPVSGCCLFARSTAAFLFLSNAFSDRRTEKRYWAIVEKAAESVASVWRELVHYVITDTKRNKSMAYEEAGPGRKQAVLRYRAVGEGERYSFLEIELITGRHHQIRAQLARVGLRIKGDLKYGARRSDPNGGIRLHAYSLAFPDPSGNGETIRVHGLPPLQDRLWQAFPQEME